jgi:hypothetical protein
MARRIYACPIAVFIGVLAVSSFVRAQAASATISGTVLDQSSSVAPGAQTAVVNLDTGLLLDYRQSFAILDNLCGGANVES